MELKQGRKGVELETSRLKGHHSTTELQPLPIHPVTQNERNNIFKFFFVLNCGYWTKGQLSLQAVIPLVIPECSDIFRLAIKNWKELG